LAVARTQGSLESPPPGLFGGEPAEARFLALAQLASNLNLSGDWTRLSEAVSTALEEIGPRPGVRIWGVAPGGLVELGRYPADHSFETAAPRDLSRAIRSHEPISCTGGTVLIGLGSPDTDLGVLEIDGGADDREVLKRMAAMVACRCAVLTLEGDGDATLAPRRRDDSGGASSVISEFARKAKRLLDHDRLSVYLLTADGRAFERFAVASSRTLAGEGVLIPFEEVGLRHVVLSNAPLVSTDLSADPRILGREDRVIAQAGFRGLLSVPLRSGGRPFGVLNFVSRKPGFYRQEDVPVAEQIADQIDVFIDNLRVQERTRVLDRNQATERERIRVARDLYHSVAQTVPEIAAAAAELEAELGPKNEAGGRAAHIRELAEQELADMRRAIIDVDPPGFGTHPLEQMIDAALERFRANTGAEAKLAVTGDTAPLSEAVQRALYRIVQESLLNCRLHSEADTVQIKLDVGRDLSLSVEDDGKGFDPAAAARGEGIGLRHMNDRAQAVGGVLTVSSSPGAGATISLVVPGVLDAVAEPDRIESGLSAGSEEFSPTIRVLVAEAGPLLRAGLCRMAESDERIRVIAESPGPDHLRTHIRQLHPDVVLLSTRLTNGDLEATIASIRAASPSTAIVMVAGSGDHSDDLIAAGADGVIHRALETEELTQAVVAVAGGSRIVIPREDGKPAAGKIESLTEREQSILALVVAGETNAQIGKQLFLATKTVERQVATVVQKLSARNRAHAAAVAVSRGIVTLPEPGHGA
jgi:signal transduction histidine kinase/DNA-binding NarL/FixJ family response regulator